MRYLATGLVALAMIACRTQSTDLCLPECGDDDQAFFAQCVANGYVDGDVECLAGNRACCAREAYCIGELDDQLVVQTSPVCELEECFRPCDGSDDLYFQECVAMGSDVCWEGEPYCCALEAACLGSLGDIEVSAPGCCSGQFDCASDEFCDPSSWTCEPNSGGFCGDSITQAGEECDDGPSPSPDCAYGESSCLVCTDVCRENGGHPSYCGDGFVDDRFELCDPLMDSTCGDDCMPIDPCANGIQDGLETDVDCGGGVCGACAIGRECRVLSDCAPPLSDLCGSTIACYPGDGGCVETSTRCTSTTTDPCLVPVCTVTGCAEETIDADFDGHPAAFLASGFDCGGDDCNDDDRNIHPGRPDDAICGPTSLGYMIDNDCDELIDEDCP